MCLVLTLVRSLRAGLMTPSDTVTMYCLCVCVSVCVCVCVCLCVSVCLCQERVVGLHVLGPNAGEITQGWTDDTQ